MKLGRARAAWGSLGILLVLSGTSCTEKKNLPSVVELASQDPLGSFVDASASPSSVDSPIALPSSDGGMAKPVVGTPPAVRYQNERYRFLVDVPTFLVAQPPPANGDGRTFVGKGVELRVWGSYASLTLANYCEEETGATVHQVTKDSCFSTGVAEQRIFWQRNRLKDRTIYGIRFEYPSAMKAEMDRVVETTYRSWVSP